MLRNRIISISIIIVICVILAITGYLIIRNKQAGEVVSDEENTVEEGIAEEKEDEPVNIPLTEETKSETTTQTNTTANNAVTTNKNNTSTSTGQTSTTTPIVPVARTWTYMADYSTQTISQINAFRQQNGKTALPISSSQNNLAKTQAQANAEQGGTASNHGFSQISYTGNAKTTPTGFVSAWEGSNSHRKSLLEDYWVGIGCAVYKDSDGRYYVVVSFDDGW